MAVDYKTARWSDYRYYPNFAAAVLFIILFLSATIFHLYKMFKTRTIFFLAFVIGGFFEWVGYIGRAWSARQSPNWTLGPFIIQSLLLLLAPALFAASMYMTLGRIILVTEGEAHSIVKRRYLTKIFVAGDVLCFLLQAGGGGIQATAKKHPSHINSGKNLILGGLVVQILFFGLFILTGIIFNIRMNKVPTPASNSVPWRTHMTVLYITNSLILFRSIFRVIEYAMGNNGYLMRHEVFLYIFDSLPMLSVMLAYVWKYPHEITELIQSRRNGFEEGGQMMHDYGQPQRLETPRKNNAYPQA